MLPESDGSHPIMQPNMEQICTNMCKQEATMGEKMTFSNDLRSHQAPSRKQRHVHLGNFK